MCENLELHIIIMRVFLLFSGEQFDVTLLHNSKRFNIFMSVKNNFDNLPSLLKHQRLFFYLV